MLGFEAEVPTLMVGGVAVVTAVFLWGMAAVYRGRGEKRGLGFFVAQWALTLAAFWMLFQLLFHPSDLGTMASEENTWTLAKCGLAWGGSILCMVLGLRGVAKGQEKA